MAPSPERRLRVGVIIPFYHPVTGGAENQCRALLKEMSASRQVEFGWLLTRRKSPALAPEELIDGVRIVRLDPPGLSRWAHYFFYLRLFFCLLRVGREVDLFHCHATSLTGACVTLAGRLLRRPVVLKLSTNGELKGPITNSTGRWGFLGDRVRKAISFFICRNATVVALNQEGMAELRHFSAVHAVLIPNGVETRRFSPAVLTKDEIRRWLELPQDKLILLYSGRLIHRKGLDLLLDPFRMVAAELENDGMKSLLCIVGSGEEQADSVEELVRSRVAENVRHVPHAHNVEQYLQAADLFVMPSRREGLPNALLEALAVGLPCILSDIAPHRELVEANPLANVRFFPSGDAAALAEAIRQACREIGEYRRNEVTPAPGLAAEYHLDAVARRYLGLYRELVNG